MRHKIEQQRQRLIAHEGLEAEHLNLVCEVERLYRGAKARTDVERAKYYEMLENVEKVAVALGLARLPGESIMELADRLGVLVRLS